MASLMMRHIPHITRKQLMLVLRNSHAFPCTCYSRTPSWSVRKQFHQRLIGSGFQAYNSHTTMRGMTESAVHIAENPDMIKLSAEIKDLDSFDHLLNFIESRDCTPENICLIFEQISNIHNQNVESGMDAAHELVENALMDKRIINLCSGIKNNPHLSSKILLQTEYLKFLSFILNISDKKISLIKAIEEQIISNLNRMTMSNLIKTLQIYHKHNEPLIRKQAYDSVCNIIEKRWVEVTRPNQIISLALSYDRDVNVLFNKLEDCIMNSSQYMTANSIYNMIYNFSRRNYRNNTVLRSLVHHLKKQEWSFKFYQFKNLLYACSVLKIHDVHLFEKIATSLTPLLPEQTSVSSLISVLTSLGKLQLLYEPLLNELYQRIYVNQDKLTEKNVAHIIISMGKLNYEDAPLLEHVKKELTSLTLKNDDSDVWLDIIWHLVALQQANDRLVSSVLEKSFYRDLLESKKSEVNWIKLKNIETAAKLEITDYSGPFSPDTLSPLHKSDYKGKTPLKEGVIAALANIAPLNKYVETDVHLPEGYFLDAVLFVNSNGQPVAYEEALRNKTGDFKRVAIIILNFMDMTSGTIQPTGIQAMATRHLKKMGYAVVEVPYKEFTQLHTVVKRVMYLQKQISSAISEEKS